MTWPAGTARMYVVLAHLIGHPNDHGDKLHFGGREDAEACLAELMAEGYEGEVHEVEDLCGPHSHQWENARRAIKEANAGFKDAINKMESALDAMSHVHPRLKRMGAAKGAFGLVIANVEQLKNVMQNDLDYIAEKIERERGGSD